MVIALYINFQHTEKEIPWKFMSLFLNDLCTVKGDVQNNHAHRPLRVYMHTL